MEKTVLFSLYSSIIELSSAINSLYLRENYSPIPILLRSIFEALADMKNLSEDKEYLKVMVKKSHREWERFFEGAQKNEGLLKSFEKDGFDIEKNLEELRERRKRLDQFKTDSGIKKKFEKAGLEGEYNTSYNRLCSHVHNDLVALMDRHMNGDDIELFRHPKPEILKVYFGMTSELLLRSAFHLYFLAQDQRIEPLAKFRSDLNEIRGDQI